MGQGRKKVPEEAGCASEGEDGPEPGAASVPDMILCTYVREDFPV